MDKEKHILNLDYLVSPERFGTSEDVNTLSSEKNKSSLSTTNSDPKEIILNSLGLPANSTSNIQLRNLDVLSGSKSSPEFDPFGFAEGVKFTKWNLIENISAKLLEATESIVILECLIDKEYFIYEEREFKLSLFNGYSLEIGNLFKICIWERDNQMMIEIKDNHKLVSETDFPNIDFFKEFGKMTLKKNI